MPSIPPLLIALLPALVAPETHDDATHPDKEIKTEAGQGETIEIVVPTKTRPDWLFPKLDHPRVQAFFNSSNSVGPSLFDPDAEAQRRPLVRAGTISVDGARNRAERKAARRFARKLVDEARPALERCYEDVLDRSPTDATRMTFHVDLDGRDRSAIQVKKGVLGDAFGNACVHGVLEFVELESPEFVASIDIPVWFWLQTV